MQRSLVVNSQGLLQDINQSNDNVVLNGDFQVAQKGASFPAIVAGSYGLDCWQYNSNIANVFDISQDVDVPTVAQCGTFAGRSLLISTRTAQPTLATGSYSFIRQPIEGYRFQSIAQVPFTLTFWVKATKAGTYNVAFQNRTVDRSIVFRYSVLAPNTWEKKIILCPASPAAGTWDYTNGIGLHVVWDLGTGATFQTTPGVWTTGNFFSSSGSINTSDTVGNQIRLALVEIRPGINPPPVFAKRSFHEELLLCQRYYVRMYLTVLDYAPVAGASSNSPIYLPVTMRATPSASFVAVGGGRYQISSANVGMFAGGHQGRFDVAASAAGTYYAIADLWEFNANL